MQARRLSKLIESDGYITAYFKNSEGKDYVGIGNGYVHDLIHIDFESMCIYTKLGPNERLREIEGKCKNLIYSGLMRELLDQNETDADFCLPVYYEENGEIKETLCAEYGYPNTTIEGYLMYNNYFFKDKKECAIRAYGSKESRKCLINTIRKTIKEKEDFLKGLQERLQKELLRIERLRRVVENEGEGEV